MTQPSPSLPNPFLDAQPSSRPLSGGRLTARPALTVFVLCLVLGLPIVGWRAKDHADGARARARAEALARSAALELQLNQVVSAAEVLGALARQSGGTIPNFQKVAAELLTAHRGLASVEIEPGGVVRDIAPRPGNERALGLNVLTHAAYGPSANATIQKRALTLTGPLPLYSGQAGVVARLPVFVPGRDGREAFWGFVAASMRLPEALALARVEELAKEGYLYAIFTPAAAGRKSVTVAAHGNLSVADAVQQPVRAQDLEFRLAVQPPGQWVSKPRLVLECLCVFAGAGLLCLLVSLIENRQALESALAEANQRLSRETADQNQAQDECRTVRAEAGATRAELERTRAAMQSSTTAELRLQAALRAAEETAQSRQAELDQVRAAHQQAEQTIASLQARLDAMARDGNTATQVLQAQLEKAQASITDLQARLETALLPAPEVAEVSTNETQPTAPAPGEPPGNQPSPDPTSVGPSEEGKTPESPESPLESPSQVDAPNRPQQLQSPERRRRRPRPAKDDSHKTPVGGEQAVVVSREPDPAQVAEHRQPASTTPEPAPNPAPVAVPEPEPAVPILAPPAPPPTLPQEIPPAEKAPRAPRRKKAKPDNQMDLFETRPAAIQVEVSSPASMPADEPAAEAPQGPTTEPSAPSATVTPAEPDSQEAETVEETDGEPRIATEPKEERRLRPLSAPPPVNPALLRKAVNQILPLFEGKDPGARDCLKANRNAFRSAFTPEGYVEFEQSVKGSDFDAALEHLRKAARRHGISV